MDIQLSYKDITLDSDDLVLLQDKYWINDKLIDFAIEYYNCKLEKAGHDSKILILNTGPVQMLKEGYDEADIRDMLSCLELDKKEFLLLPINDNDDVTQPGGLHWSLLLYDMKEGVAYRIDSAMDMNEIASCKAAQKLHAVIHGSSSSKPLRILLCPDCPQQNNGYDCGMFVISNIKQLLTFLIHPNKSLDPQTLRSQLTPVCVRQLRVDVKAVIDTLRVRGENVTIKPNLFSP